MSRCATGVVFSCDRGSGSTPLGCLPVPLGSCTEPLGMSRQYLVRSPRPSASAFDGRRRASQPAASSRLRCRATVLLSRPVSRASCDSDGVYRSGISAVPTSAMSASVSMMCRLGAGRSDARTALVTFQRLPSSTCVTDVSLWHTCPETSATVGGRCRPGLASERTLRGSELTTPGLDHFVDQEPTPFPLRCLCAGRSDACPACPAGQPLPAASAPDGRPSGSPPAR